MTAGSTPRLRVWFCWEEVRISTLFSIEFTLKSAWFRWISYGNYLGLAEKQQAIHRHQTFFGFSVGRAVESSTHIFASVASSLNVFCTRGTNSPISPIAFPLLILQSINSFSAKISLLTFPPSWLFFSSTNFPSNSLNFIIVTLNSSSSSTKNANLPLSCFAQKWWFGGKQVLQVRCLQVKTA